MMVKLVFNFLENVAATTPFDFQSLYARSQYWAAAFYMTCAPERGEAAGAAPSGGFRCAQGRRFARALAVRGRVVMAAVDFCLISQLLPSLIAYAELPELPYASDLDTQTLE
jgi:hypothetical protein